MTAPLALFLTRFSAPPPEPIAAVPPQPEPRLSISPGDLAARIASAAAEAREEADRRHATTIAALTAAHAAEAAGTLEAARTEWAKLQGEALASRFDAGLADLRTYLAQRVAAALRPLMATALQARLKDDALEAIDRLLADPGAPVLSVRAPADLIEALRAARPGPGIEWIADDGIDVSIAAGAARVEGRLVEALAALGVEEA